MKEISAGGIVFKKEGKETKVLMIEDKYYKVTIPKGKQESGETLEQTAIREIEEETGIKGHIVGPLDKVYYKYIDGERGSIDKEVTYYLVEAVGGEVQVQIEEINQVYWLSLGAALDLQKRKGYDNNDDVFEKAYEYLSKVH